MATYLLSISSCLAYSYNWCLNNYVEYLFLIIKKTPVMAITLSSIIMMIIMHSLLHINFAYHMAVDNKLQVIKSTKKIYAQKI